MKMNLCVCGRVNNKCLNNNNYDKIIISRIIYFTLKNKIKFECQLHSYN